MNQQEIIQYCNDFLSIENFKDYCPNGLQVEGDNREVKKIVTGVSLSEEFIDLAIAEDADLVICHHGMIWNNDDRVIQGPFKRKLYKLMSKGIAAAAYHLPLDFHDVLGNNVQLAKKIGLYDLEGLEQAPGYAEGVMGAITPCSVEELVGKLNSVLERQPVVLPFGKDKLNKVAIVTGGAQGYFEKAIKAGADCFITGEVSEKNYGMSQEYGVHFISAGHYATEKCGIQALGKHIMGQLDIICDFIEFPNPI